MIKTFIIFFSLLMVSLSWSCSTTISSSTSDSEKLSADVRNNEESKKLPKQITIQFDTLDENDLNLLTMIEPFLLEYNDSFQSKTGISVVPEIQPNDSSVKFAVNFNIVRTKTIMNFYSQAELSLSAFKLGPISSEGISLLGPHVLSTISHEDADMRALLQGYDLLMDRLGLLVNK